jgi:biopolymer transport protein ExbD
MGQIRFICPTAGCGAALAIDATAVGRSARCPKCRQMVAVPAESSADAESCPLIVFLDEMEQYEASGSTPIADMNVIPFIDVCLVLLIIVLVTAAFSIKLMAFEHPLAIKKAIDGSPVLDDAGNVIPIPTQFVDIQDKDGNPQVATVRVTGNGPVELNGQSVPVAELGQAVARLKGPDGRYPPFLMVVSRNVESQYIVMAVDQISQDANVEIVYTLEGEPLAIKKP